MSLLTQQTKLAGPEFRHAGIHQDGKDNRHLISHLQNEFRRVLDSLIPAGSSVVLLDYPNNLNVGDSLIWLGEVAYLASRGITPRYVCDLKNYDPYQLRKTLDSNSIILLHGGGNFGTLWPDEQVFRLRVLKDFPGIPTIQLPQSLYFDDEQKIEESAAAIRQHGNFKLLTRDIPSYEFAASRFNCQVTMCPDSAFFIGAIDSGASPLVDRFVLSRTDHEKSIDWLEKSPQMMSDLTMETADWLNVRWPERILSRVARYTHLVRRIIDRNNHMLFKIWNALARARLQRGKAMLERGRVVITDRLHVHILSILLNKPHVAIDTKYGKLGNFHAAWTQHYCGAKFARNVGEAFELAREFDTLPEEMDGEACLQSQ